MIGTNYLNSHFLPRRVLYRCATATAEPIVKDLSALAFETWPTFVRSLLGLRDDCDLVDWRLPHGLHDDGDVVADGELVVEFRRGTRLLDLCWRLSCC